MANEPQYLLSSQIDVSPSGSGPQITVKQNLQDDVNGLLRELIIAQHRQNELLEEVVESLSQPQRQRLNELRQWKKDNEELSRLCKFAADKMGQVQTEFLNSLVDEINENYENIQGSEYYFNEFIDRFGPRMVHMSSLLQLLSQLGAGSDYNSTQLRK